MAYWWLTDLADALRSDPWLAKRVVEYSGWQQRGRPASQFSFAPSGVLDHHTACMINPGHNPQTCINQIIAGNADAPGPIAQVLETWTPAGVKYDGANVDPRIYVLAAGRANHAGAGVWPWGAPSGNGSAIGFECCGPPGEGWPDIVIEMRERATAAVLQWYHWPVSHSTIHWEYATPRGRKIDPSGRYAGQPNLGELAHWDPNIWRSRIASRLNDVPPKPVPAPNPDPAPLPGPPALQGGAMPWFFNKYADAEFWIVRVDKMAKWGPFDYALCLQAISTGAPYVQIPDAEFERIPTIAP